VFKAAGSASINLFCLGAWMLFDGDEQTDKNAGTIIQQAILFMCRELLENDG
jgi:hypothetical protein